MIHTLTRFASFVEAWVEAPWTIGKIVTGAIFVGWVTLWIVLLIVKGGERHA